MRDPKLFDSIALLADIPEEGLERGNLGAIVHVHNGGEAFEVEFVDDDGRTYGLTALTPDQFMLVHRHAMERIAA